MAEQYAQFDENDTIPGLTYGGVLNAGEGDYGRVDQNYSRDNERAPEQQQERQQIVNTEKDPWTFKSMLSDTGDSVAKMMKTDRGAEVFLKGIAGSAGALLNWLDSRAHDEAKREMIDQQAAHNKDRDRSQFELQQQQIENDIKRRSSRAKITNSTKLKV